MQEPNEETRRRFEQWVALHQQHMPTGTPPLLGPSAASAAGGPPPHHASMLGHSSAAAAMGAAMQRPGPGHYGSGDPRRLQHPSSVKLEGLSHPGLPEHVHPALQVSNCIYYYNLLNLIQFTFQLYSDIYFKYKVRKSCLIFSISFHLLLFEVKDS